MNSDNKIREEILLIFSGKDIQESEAYIRKISRNELIKELMDKGFDKGKIDRQLSALCNKGAFALDEQNVYQYEES